MLQIMLVEDETPTRLGLRQMIEEAGDCVLIGEARGGREALEQLRRQPPQLLLSDIMMPQMNGLELAGEAKRLYPRLEVVLISGYDDFDYVREGLRRGVHDYLLKPVEPEELHRVLRQVAHKLDLARTALPQTFARMQQWRDLIATLAGHLWMAEEAAFDRQWRALAAAAAEELGDRLDMHELYQQLLYRMSERIGDDYGGRLPEAAFRPVDFTGRVGDDLQAAHAQLRTLMRQLRAERNWGRSQAVLRAMQLAEAQADDPALSLQETAEQVGLSVSHLSRMFRMETGRTFVEFVTELRMKRARQLLEDPAAMVYEVAGRVGYNEYSHFARVFRKQIGCSPSEYRRRLGIR
ncbi:helix-turn-helix domain-containing protein [Paenibacillus sp. IB182496]|uniref:Helix-turn-helix domain-containing protein n=1 Tax=Paenibacillus sabuli TaxID=2772509 RepID=A0A927BQ12_9BACL|nr:helix-turn-helix domain-containing protein [Paenibacillus sabuli]MBD2843831.1 helix-turn-helix domain-containing protein [Paenibacillus sabuli]